MKILNISPFSSRLLASASASSTFLLLCCTISRFCFSTKRKRDKKGAHKSRTEKVRELKIEFRRPTLSAREREDVSMSVLFVHFSGEMSGRIVCEVKESESQSFFATLISTLSHSSNINTPL